MLRFRNAKKNRRLKRQRFCIDQLVNQPAERVHMNETADAMPLFALFEGALRFSVAFHEM